MKTNKVQDLIEYRKSMDVLWIFKRSLTPHLLSSICLQFHPPPSYPIQHKLCAAFAKQNTRTQNKEIHVHSSLNKFGICGMCHHTMLDKDIQFQKVVDGMRCI